MSWRTSSRRRAAKRVQWPSAEKQQIFTRNQGLLIVWAIANGFALTGGQWLRSAAQAADYAAAGTGIITSLHIVGLAMDWNLFINGIYRKDAEAHEPLGAYWKSLHPLNRWGGDFLSRPDGNHYSMEHEGIK